MTKEQLIEEIKAGRITTAQQAVDYMIKHFTDMYFYQIIPEGSNAFNFAQHLLSEHGAKVAEAPKPLTAEEVKQKAYEFAKMVSPNENGVRANLQAAGKLIHVLEWMMRFAMDLASQQNAELKEKNYVVSKMLDNANKQMDFQQQELESLRKKCDRMYSRTDMEKCFEAGVNFGRNMDEFPSNSEYIESLTGDKEKGGASCA